MFVYVLMAKSHGGEFVYGVYPTMRQAESANRNYCFGYGRIIEEEVSS